MRRGHGTARSEVAMSEICVVDLSPFYNGGVPGRLAVANEVDRACREVGFFAVVGHQIDADLVARTRASVRAFFDLAVEEKMKWCQPTSNGRGYVPLKSETLSATTAYHAAPDYKETFSIGPIDVGSEPYYRFEPSGIAFAPNVWPDRPGDLSTNLRTCYRELNSLAADLMRLTALAFGLPEEFFDPHNDRPTSALRVLHYPPHPDLQPGQYPASPHTDYGTWTILHKRPGLTGLQAESVKGHWVDVVAPEGGFVVNVGDLLMRWTGGHWLSTLHRVVPVRSADPNGELSLVMFHQPNWDSVVYPFTEDVVYHDALGARYQAGALERDYSGVMTSEFVYGKYRASITSEPAST